ncbi:MAG: hypothetical protein M1817_006533 [Caeruleum heppii]|nr:MAG: hypothetical protein M1817_006533 [Caeruleum heppii]
MSATFVQDSNQSVASRSTNDFFNDEMRQLLKEAEQRLLASSDGIDLDLRESDNSLSKSDMAAANDTAPSFRLPKLRSAPVAQPYINAIGDMAHVDSSSLIDLKQRKLAHGIRTIEDPVQVRERLMHEKQATAGLKWFNLPKTNLTPELKRDLQLLQMRSVLDPKRHYKKSGSSKKSFAPEFSQVGTIIEGPTEYFSGRITKKERKQTFVEEVLSKDDTMKRFKSKYNDIQAKKTSGKKEFYKKLKEQRSRGGKKR